jgi:hypothetical protein
MDSSKIIFICKKKLIRLIEKIPVRKNIQTEDEKNSPFCIPLQISGHLLRNLPIKEESFRLISSFSHKDARSYYLYAVVSEVLSSCMSCIRVAGWLEESEEEILFGYPKMNVGNETISGGRVRHLFDRSIVDEFEVRFRKLQEYLCNLICFSETNDQKYFKLFLTAEAFADINYANQDIFEFFGNPIENFNFQSNELLAQCKILINDLDRDKCWFLRTGANFDSNLNLSIMSSFRQRYKKAISIASSGEKVVLGPTYKVGYGGSSKSAHALIEEYCRDFTLDDVKHSINKIPVICLNILLRAFEIVNIDYPKNFKKLLEDARSGEVATRGIENVTQGNLNVGDLVTTDLTDVAEIIKVNTSSYGYKSYYVRYLINPKIKEISEEWLPPRYIGPCLIKKQDARKIFTQNVVPLLKEKSVDWIDKKTDLELYNYAKTSILQMAREGNLQLFFRKKPE